MLVCTVEGFRNYPVSEFHQKMRLIVNCKSKDKVIISSETSFYGTIQVRSNRM